MTAETFTTEGERERHATNLELFLDLVFVFAITQIASLLAKDPTAKGFAHGLFMTWLVWWQWSQFTWTGSAIDLQQVRHTRVLVLCMIPFALLNAVAIPTVFGDGAMWFAATYAGILAIVLAIQGTAAWHQEHTRIAWIRYSTIAAIAPVIVLVGALFDGEARTLVWTAAVVVGIIGALRASSAGEWSIDPVHFAERHALFIIISLGEVLVAAGATATSVGLTADMTAGLTLAVAAACVMWWTYFAFIPEIAEHRLREAHGRDRGRLARDVFTLAHFPLVVGLVSYAVVAKHLVEHPEGHLSPHDRWMLAISGASFIGGLMCIQFRVVRRVAPERVAAAVAIVALCILGQWLPGLLVVGLVAVVVGVMQAITVHRVRRSRR